MDRSYPRQRYSMVVEGYAELSINQEIKELKALAQEYRDRGQFSHRSEVVVLEEAAQTLAHGGTLTGLDLREQELMQDREKERNRKQERETELARDQHERDHEDAPEPDPSPFRFRSMTAQEIERELMGGTIERPYGGGCRSARRCGRARRSCRSGPHTHSFRSRRTGTLGSRLPKRAFVSYPNEGLLLLGYF